MIKYRLICKNCEISFDSWFSSSLEYEKLKNKRFLPCHYCNSKNIEKTLMAPNMITNKSLGKFNKDEKKIKNIKKKIQEYQKFIKSNFEYVGENFAFEARSIHYRKKKEKGIFGSASKKEIQELKEEGIETQVIPWIEDKSN